MQPLGNFPPRDPSLRVVGVPTRHDSAVRHVCGTAAYIDDLREPEGPLHLAAGGAAAARGRIVRIDLDAVRGAPGVVAVLTAADIPGKNDVSPVMGDDPMFATDAVEFHGQVVFAVVAEIRDLARRAARLGTVEVAAERPLVSVDDALAADAHILPDYAFSKGDCAAALAASPRRIAGTFRMGGQEHFYLEGQVALAIPGEDEMTVHSSTQHPSELQHIVAHVLGLPNAAVTVEVRRMGLRRQESQAAQWAAIAALAARITGRPCKFRLDRDDDMSLTGKRHDFRVDYQAGSATTAGSRPSTSTSPRVAAIPPTCPARSTTAPCSTPTTPITSRPLTSSPGDEDQHGLQLRFPWLRRPPGQSSTKRNPPVQLPERA